MSADCKQGEAALPPVACSGVLQAGAEVTWTNHDRRGMRSFSGVIVGDCVKRNTHVRVQTAQGIREVNRMHLRQNAESIHPESKP